MDSTLRAAIEEHPVVDISTHGPKSGATRRIEIRLLHADGRIFLSGRPGRRSWYANLRANPQLTPHVKRGAEGDVDMTMRPITDTGATRGAVSHRVAEGTRRVDRGLAAGRTDRGLARDRGAAPARRSPADPTAPAALKIAGVTDRKVSRALVGLTLAESPVRTLP
jgi:F420H(2)-dependent quinone reductase